MTGWPFPIVRFPAEEPASAFVHEEGTVREIAEGALADVLRAALALDDYERARIKVQIGADIWPLHEVKLGRR